MRCLAYIFRILTVALFAVALIELFDNILRRPRYFSAGQAMQIGG